MKKHVTWKNIAALTRIGTLCALAVVSISVSPTFAAALSRDVDIGATLAAVWSMIAPRSAMNEWLPPLARLRARCGGPNLFAAIPS